MYRRSQKRYEIDASAILVINKNLEETFILKNFSARGAGVVSDYPLKTNDQVTIIFQFPFLFENPIRKEATVVWCKKLSEMLWESGLDFGLDNMINLVPRQKTTLKLI